MKAVVYSKYGPPDVLQLRDVEKPIPKDNEIRIKIYATTVTSGDVIVRSFKHIPLFLWLPFRIATGFTKPKKPTQGSDFAGEIDAVGENVKLFKTGDRVFGIDGDGLGAYAEYKCLSETAALTIMPGNMDFEEAAAIPFGAHTALCFLKDKGHIQPGQKVLIYGASSSVGSAAVQIAKYYEAEVTGVCSTTNINMVKSLGADKVIDYTQEDFSKNGETYDIIFDAVTKSSYSQCKNSLSAKGFYMATFPSMSLILQMLWTSIAGGRKVIHSVAAERKEDMVFFKQLIETGKLKAVIDKCYPLEEIAEAHRYVEQGHKKGNVVMTVQSYSDSKQQEILN